MDLWVESLQDELAKLKAENEKLKAERDAWSDEAHKMVTQRNLLADQLAALTGKHAGDLIEEVAFVLGTIRGDAP